MQTEGNAAMAEQDYVNAMKWYSQAIALSPRDGALFSNRSFAFLRLGLTSRALADADEAVRRRPEWNKGHFRRAACLKQAGLHAEAHAAYATAARLDPADARPAAEAQRHALQQRTERLYAVVGALAGVVLFALLVLAPPTRSNSARRRRRPRHQGGRASSALASARGAEASRPSGTAGRRRRRR